MNRGERKKPNHKTVYELECMILSKMNQRKTNTLTYMWNDLTYMWNLRNKANEQRGKEKKPNHKTDS